MSRIVVLSRGHGYGHAARDHQIVQAIRGQHPDCEVLIASSGTGLEYYVTRSVPCLDLAIPDDDDQSTGATLRVLQFLSQIEKPDLVVADEVFSAPSICKMLGIRNVLLTNWLFSEFGEPELDELYEGAAVVIMLDFAAAHPTPSTTRIPIHFAGALAQEFCGDSSQCRRALGVSDNDFIAVGTFGAVTAEKAPEIHRMLDVILDTWCQNARPNDRLFLLANAHMSHRVACPKSLSRVEWVGITEVPEVYYQAANVVIANATLTTLSNLARNNIPTVAIVGSQNPVSSLHARYFTDEGFIQSFNLYEANDLWMVMQRAIHDKQSGRLRGSQCSWATPLSVANYILSYLPS